MGSINRYLEDELHEALSSLNLGSKTDRNVQITISYMGLDGKGGRKGGFPMSAVGKPYGLTREMIRQINAKVDKEAKSSIHDMHRLKQSQAIVESMLPAEARDIEIELKKQGITRTEFRVEGIVNALNMFGIKNSIYKIVEQKRGRFVVANEKQADWPSLVMSEAGWYVGHNGACNVDDLASQLSGQKESRTRFVKGVIRCRAEDDMVWVNEGKGWFYFTKVKRNRVIKRVRKMFSACESVQIEELREGIRRSFAKDKTDKYILLEAEVMIGLLEASGEFLVETGGIVKANNLYDMESELRPFEKGIVDRILKSPIGTVREGELEKDMVYGEGKSQADINKDKYSFSVALNFCPVIKRMKRGVYGLVGTPSNR